jgi:hypothetical protein
MARPARPFLPRGASILVAAVIAAASFGLAGCGPSEVHTPKAEPTRPVDFEKCPKARLVPLPPGFHLVNRELQALKDNHMGELLVYNNGKRQLQVFSGPDLFGSLDDIDLTAVRVTAGGHDFDLWSTAIFPDLKIAVLQDGRLKEPCTNVGLLTKNIAKPDVIKLLADLQVGTSSPP